MGDQPKPRTFIAKPDELFLEKFFNEYIKVWYRESILSAVQYDKARKELDLLKEKNTKLKEKKQINKRTDNDTPAGRQLPQSNQDGHNVAAVRPKSGRRKDASANVVSANKWSSGEAKSVETRDERYLQIVNEKEKLLLKVNTLKEKLSLIRANAHYELDEKDDKIKKLEKHLENSREQNNDLSKRLSKLAGDKLRQGNPDLADLSDRYRPTEIGKMFSEVYDNEWSDAYENIPKMDEDKKVGILHGIVTKAFNFCDEKFNEQTMTVRTTLLGLGQGSEEDNTLMGNKTVRVTNIQNTLKEVRKELAMETARNVAKQFSSTLEQYVSGAGIKANAIDKTLRIYAAKCVELCWLMVICDPPMALSEDKIGNPYDTNIYKPYTRSMKDLKNPVVILAIWPALHLHIGGSLVGKGVAQPGEKSKQ